jgi:succinate dehydrogenase/fumarate reductase flavoprotein subunit
VIGDPEHFVGLAVVDDVSKQIEVHTANRLGENALSFTGAKAGKIVLDRVRKQRGCSRAKASEIKVEKRVYESRVHYIAHYGDKAIQLA